MRAATSPNFSNLKWMLFLAVVVLLLFLFGVSDVTRYLFVAKGVLSEHGVEILVALAVLAAISLVYQPASKP
jgi:hypothetical protein